MKIIQGWKEKKLHCHFCGQTTSVRYTLRLRDEAGQINTVTCCNRCVLRYMEEEVDEDT